MAQLTGSPDGRIRLRYVPDRPWVWVVIDRPLHRNALTDAMWRELELTFDRLAKERHLRCVLLTGEGDQAFSAGADIIEFGETKRARDLAVASFEQVARACQAVEACPLPVVAVIRGVAAGGGLELALACDLRLAASDARLGFTGSRLGVTVGAQHIRRLLWAVGPTRAMEMLMTGRLVSGREALEIGLVNAVYPAADLVTAASDLAATLAERAPLAVRWAKEAIGHLRWDPALAHWGNDAERSVACFATEDFWEGVAAFRAKRPPRFTGQ